MLNTLRYCWTVIFILIGVSSSIYAAELQDPPEENWRSLDLNPQSLDYLLGEVNVGGPRLLSQDFTPYRAQGVLEGCGFSFQVLLRDWAYRSNQPTFVYGSVVYFRYPERVPILSLRIALRDVENREGSLWQNNTSVNYAYLRRGRESMAGKEQLIVDGEDNAKSFIYFDPEFDKLQWLMIGDFLNVGFNRQAGGSDLEFDLPIMYTDAWQSMGGCIRELAER